MSGVARAENDQQRKAASRKHRRQGSHWRLTLARAALDEKFVLEGSQKVRIELCTRHDNARFSGGCTVTA